MNDAHNALEDANADLRARLEDAVGCMEDLRSVIGRLRADLHDSQEKLSSRSAKCEELREQLNAARKDIAFAETEKESYKQKFTEHGQIVEDYVKKLQREIKRRFGFMPPSLELTALYAAPSFAQVGSHLSNV